MGRPTYDEGEMATKDERYGGIYRYGDRSATARELPHRELGEIRGTAAMSRVSGVWSKLTSTLVM